ncbi:class I SAM-dependent methyltransferase [Pelotomaculum propionicicum]|uniref:class I SAM-dependent methyltransferase n=1 Tax=Pelotomaculum propionicicum TaxID=258475 RepID=UPI003B75E40F
MDKVVLTREKETLLIPLFGKAKESTKDRPVLVDRKAVEIVSRIDYDFSSLKIPEKTNVMMCLRAKLIDNFVKDFLARDTESAAVHLGCGLDSRYDRVGNSCVDWYDVDFKEVIDIRKIFYTETDKYHLIGSSVTENGWLKEIPTGKNQYIVIAEGLFMYLQEDEIKTLLSRLKDRIGSYTLIFDAFSVYTASRVRNHPSIKKTGAVIKWGVDDPGELAKWVMGIQFIKEEYFTSNKETGNLSPGMRAAFGIANLFPFVKKAQRLLIYKVHNT